MSTCFMLCNALLFGNNIDFSHLKYKLEPVRLFCWRLLDDGGYNLALKVLEILNRKRGRAFHTFHSLQIYEGTSLPILSVLWLK